MVKMIATPSNGKKGRYGTRMLDHGDEFEASANYARMYSAVKKARYADGKAPSLPKREPPRANPLPQGETDQERHARLYPNQALMQTLDPAPEQEPVQIADIELASGPDLEPEIIQAPVAPPMEPPPAPAPAPTPEPAPEDSEPVVEGDERPALRIRYKELFGKSPFPGWTAEDLKGKISAVG